MRGSWVPRRPAVNVTVSPAIDTARAASVDRLFYTFLSNHLPGAWTSAKNCEYHDYRRALWGCNLRILGLGFSCLSFATVKKLEGETATTLGYGAHLWGSFSTLHTALSQRPSHHRYLTSVVEATHDTLEPAFESALAGPSERTWEPSCSETGPKPTRLYTNDESRPKADINVPIPPV